MSDDRDLGGEAACWAHLLDDLDTNDREPGTRELAVGDLTDVADEGSDGAVWSLPHGGDLDANIVRLERGHSIAEHVNDDVDVLIVVWRGDGRLAIDEGSVRLRAGVVTNVPRGTRRTITAGEADLVYVSVHRRRDGLAIRARG